jgi:hypothetical protein
MIEGKLSSRSLRKLQGDNTMKKLIGLMLGLSLALGCVAFADDAATTATKATKAKKAKKTKATKDTAATK